MSKKNSTTDNNPDLSTPLTPEEHKEMKELRKKIKRVEMEIEIFKKLEKMHKEDKGKK